MNANLVSILSWTRPYKSGIAWLSVNVVFWFLTHQRPICVMSLAALCVYLRYLWKHRIRPEVLVDPPDSEDWVTLSSYDLEQQYVLFVRKLWSMWINLRGENHLMFTAVTCTMWIFLAKLGSQMDFVTLLFVISNAAFLLIPLLKVCPFELPSDDGVIKEEDLIPEVPKKAAASKTSKSRSDSRSPKKNAPKSSTSSLEEELAAALHPVLVGETKQPSSSKQRMSPTLDTSLTEGMLTRSMAAAAASFANSGLSSPSSVMSASAAVISSLYSQASSQLSKPSPSPPAEATPDREFMFSPAQLEALGSSSGPDSLTPAVSAMPDHEQDSDPEDEFLFDAKHFDKSSSSSSTSNSFEIINNI